MKFKITCCIQITVIQLFLIISSAFCQQDDKTINLIGYLDGDLFDKKYDKLVSHKYQGSDLYIRVYFNNSEHIKYEIVQIDSLNFLKIEFDIDGNNISKGNMFITDSVFRTDTIPIINPKNFKEEYYTFILLLCIKHGFWEEWIDTKRYWSGNYVMGKKEGDWQLYSTASYHMSKSPFVIETKKYTNGIKTTK